MAQEQVKQNIIVTFHEYDEAKLDDNIYEYVTVVFEAAIGYQLGSGFLGVQGADGNFTIYPQERIREVKIEIQE